MTCGVEKKSKTFFPYGVSTYGILDDYFLQSLMTSTLYCNFAENSSAFPRRMRVICLPDNLSYYNYKYFLRFKINASFHLFALYTQWSEHFMLKWSQFYFTKLFLWDVSYITTSVNTSCPRSIVWSHELKYSSTVELQYNVLASSASKRLVYWSLPLFLDHFYIYNKKRSAANRTVFWIWPLFWEDGKLEFHCI